MKNIKKILGLVTVLIAVGLLSMFAFAEAADVQSDITEQENVEETAQADEEFVCPGECTGECEGEGPIQARDGTGTGMQKRLGGAEGRVNGEGKGLRNGEGQCLANGEGAGQGRGYRGGRN